MFTGIVETMGTVEEVKPLDSSESGGNGFAVTIANAEEVLSDCHLGDSISTNGVCLTVTEFTKSTFKVGIAPETLSRTNLGSLVKGDRVNLERAVSGSTRLGGHMVQGHIDTVATIVKVKSDGNSLRLTFRPKNMKMLSYIVEKGFIALEGASLTVTEVTDSTFSVMLIAHTQSNITLGTKKVGDVINVEVDLVGKLIEKQVKGQVKKQVKKQLKKQHKKNLKSDSYRDSGDVRKPNHDRSEFLFYSVIMMVLALLIVYLLIINVLYYRSFR